MAVAAVLVAAAVGGAEGRSHAPTCASSPGQYQHHDEMRGDQPNALLRVLVKDVSPRQALLGAAAPHPTMSSVTKEAANKPD